VLLRALEGEGEGKDVTKDKSDDEGEGGELGTVLSISETSSTAPYAVFVDPVVIGELFFMFR
jgi:hypothetical protein